MNKHKILSLISMVILIVLIKNNLIGIGYPKQALTVEIDRVMILEDRDFGSGEVYVKATINNSASIFSYIYRDIGNNEEVKMNWIIYTGNCSSLTIKIEVYESDDEYNEAENDYLGFFQIVWNVSNIFDEWHDCLAPVGGNQPIQSRIYLISHDSILSFEPVDPGGSTQEYSDLLGFFVLLIMLLVPVIGLYYFIKYRKKSAVKSVVFTPDIITPKKSILHGLGEPFFCQVDGTQHPATDEAFKCEKCSRFVCENCYTDMKQVGRVSCPMCDGQLRHA